MSDIESNLKNAGIVIPDAPAPAANYVPYVISGNQVIVSGQISKDGDTLLTGKLGAEVSVAEGQKAARVCAINLMAQLKSAIGGDWSKLKRVVRLGGFVNCTPDFGDQPAVINGASDLMVEIFGDKGRHARAAVGTSSLPFHVSVEIDAIFEIEV